MAKEILDVKPPLEARVWAYSARYAGDRRRHRHDELEFNLVTAGTATYLVNDSRYDLTTGTLIWLYPQDEHLLIQESSDFAMLIVVARPSLVRQWAKQPFNRPLSRQRPVGPISRDLRPDSSRELRLLLESQCNLGPEQYEQLNAGVAFATLRAWWLFQHEPAASPAQAVHPAVRRAHQLLHSGDNDLSLPELAAACGLSPSHLSRLFRQQSGISIAEYRNRRRLERYLAIVDHKPTCTVLEAAFEAGFGSYPQFHRVFLQVFGTSPARHRGTRVHEGLP